jgi:hypothetical protein
MSDVYGFGVRAFGCNIQVTTTTPEARTALDCYVFPTLPRVVCFARQPDLAIRIDRVVDQFQLSVNGLVAASTPKVVDLAPDIIRTLDESVIQKLTTLRAVHAGAVLWNGQALLLPGKTHAGKSSLVAELLRRGATYFSDEYALIDSEGRAHPYPRPLLMRNGCPEQFPMLPDEFGALAGDAPAPIGWILSLAYQPAGNWGVAAVSQSEALMILLKNTPHVLTESPQLINVFRRAVAGATCYVGCRGEAAQSVDEIFRLMESCCVNCI